MHGRRADGGEGCGKRRPFLRHMWPATRVEAAPPPAKGPSSPPPRSSAPPLRTTSYPPAPTTPPASTHKEEGADSPRPASADSFIKDGREFRVGDCALFQAVDVPPFIGLIRWIEKKEGFPKLRVSWLYRSADVKLNKGLQVNAAPNEIFYSFHQDETSAVSLLHPCKVAFLRKGVELPAGISSFVCRRVYDIDNRCLWWLTDRDYINERQEEVNRLLHRTRLEMHAAVQSGGRSPKRLNGPSPQQKSGSDDAQSCGLSKGRKRDRTEQGIDPAKRDHERTLKVEDGEWLNFKVDTMKSEIAKFADKGGLPHAEAVEKLVKCMQLDQIERKMDLAGRVMLAEIIAATESTDCLGRFVQLRGLPILNEWLQETRKGKSGEGGSPRETDKPIEEFLLALLRALAKLPINLNALQSCSIGKSVNHLRSHKNKEIQRKAKCLVENWKKRVDAEMKSTDAKPVLSGPAISWSGKAVFPEISSAGNGRSGSSEPSPGNPLSQLTSPKALSAKPGTAEAAAKSNPSTFGSSKLQHIQPANVATNLKDPPCNSTGGTCGPDFPSVKEEKSCSSSQSLNNSQSCSSDHGKTVGPLKDDARRSTAASANASKMSGSSARGHRRSNNGLVKKEVGFQKEAALGRSSPLDRSLLLERSSQSGMACEKGGEALSDHVNSHRLIVRFPNPGRSPGRSTIGASCEDPSISGSRASSPILADKHEQIDRRVKMKTEHSRPHLGSDANTEPAQSNPIERATGSEEGDKSSSGVLDGDCSRTAEEAGKDASASQGPSSLYVNEKGICLGETTVRNSFNPLNALIEIKYSEASHSMQAGDDTAMNLLASVAGEVSRSELVMPSTSPGKPPVNELGCEGESIGKLEVECDAGPSKHSGPSDGVEKDICEKEDESNASFVAKEEEHLRDSGTNSSSHDSKGATSTRPSPLPGIDSNAVESSANTGSHEVECANKCSHIPSSVDSLGGGDQKSSVRQPADIKIDTQFSRNSSVSEPRNAWTVGEKVEDGCVSSSDQKHLLGLPDHIKTNDRSTDSTAGNLVSKPSLTSLNENVKTADGLVVKEPKEDEKKEQHCSTSADVTKLALPAVLPPGPANGNGMVEESKGSSSELSSHVKPRALTSPDNEHSARQSSKKLCDFDLNELGDEGNHSGPATSPVICSAAIHLPGLSPFVSPISSGLPAPITVAAPAKGPFVPPENLLRVKPDAGWKGSAATSAFRPAEPRKILGMFLTAPDTAVSDNAGKQSRPAFDIDLNVADDQVLEDDISQSSAQTIGSESGNSRSHNGRVQSAGIELDLNRADEVAENSQFISNASHRIEVSLLPARSLPGVPSNAGTNSSRNFFDLNNGPCLDEASTELAQRSLSSKSTSSIPFLPQVPGVRMNSADMSSMSPWFGSANSCAPVAIQSFLPARAEQPYPIDTAPGTQRFIAPAAEGGQFRSDFCRAPVISSSPTMVFPPPAYQYAGFPFTPSVHLPTTGFPMGSTSYANAAPAGVPYFPTIVPSHVGSTGVLPVQHARQYAMNLAEGTSRDGQDSNWKWRRQGLDLNSGPGSTDAEGKDERLVLSSRPNVVTPPQAFVEEQTRMYQMPGIGIKRKEPEGSWDAERSSSYKQLSWQ